MTYPTSSSASDVWSLRDVYKAVAGGDWPGSAILDFYQDNASATPAELMSAASGKKIVFSVYWANANQTDPLFNTTGLTTSSEYGRNAEQLIQKTSGYITSSDGYGYCATGVGAWSSSQTLIFYGKNTSTGNHERLFAVVIDSGLPTDWWNYVGLNPALSGSVAATADAAPIYQISGSVYGSDGTLAYSFSNHNWRWSSGAYVARRKDDGTLFQDATTLQWQCTVDGTTARGFDDGGWYFSSNLASNEFYNADAGADGFSGNAWTRFDPANAGTAGKTGVYGFLNNNSDDNSGVDLYLNASADSSDVRLSYDYIYGLVINN